MSLRIIKAGLMDTIQDGGRHGFAYAGISPSGPMDIFSASFANALLGQNLGESVIEIHFPAPVIEITQPCILAFTGADFSASINDVEIPVYQPVLVTVPSVLRFITPVSGARGYIGVFPRMKLKKWMGSVSTNLRTNGGLGLRSGDIINLDKGPVFRGGSRLLPWHSRQNTSRENMRIIRGPNWNLLTNNSRQEFLSEHFSVTSLSDRMGFRLKGPYLRTISEDQLLSSAVGAGTVQLLPDGNPVVLMADHPTTGGYPRIAAVISADLGRLAQLTPGNSIRFSIVDIEEAERSYLSMLRYLEELKALSGAEMRAFLK